MAEADLVVRARRDRSAFAVLYDRYYPQVLRYCLRRLFVRAVAEDVTSDVFLRVARHLPGFDGSTETDFRRWLFGIAGNAVNAYVRQTRRRAELAEAAARSRAARASSAPAAELLDWPTVYQAILELEPRDQTILMLRFYADLTHEEIGAVVAATAGAVRTALCRILDRLRRRLGVDRSEQTLAEGPP
jgi:RNA polymerase sigma-70 factor (ECF subfamily)